MIASIRGKVIYTTSQLRKDSYFIVEAGGVGYKIFSTGKAVNQVKVDQELIAYTYMSVSERGMDLYGFLQPADKTLFTLLLNVPGIGPKSALSVLEKASMAEVREAALNDDPSILVKMAGLGMKTAEKIVITLKDKVESLSAKPGKGSKFSPTDADVFDVLETFGYSRSEAREALAKVDSSVETSERVRQALKLLGKK